MQQFLCYLRYCSHLIIQFFLPPACDLICMFRFTACEAHRVLGCPTQILHAALKHEAVAINLATRATKSVRCEMEVMEARPKGTAAAVPVRGEASGHLEAIALAPRMLTLGPWRVRKCGRKRPQGELNTKNPPRKTLVSLLAIPLPTCQKQNQENCFETGGWVNENKKSNILLLWYRLPPVTRCHVKKKQIARTKQRQV